METGGPYLNMAVLCERALQERDGTLSLIRILDRLTISSAGPAPPEKIPAGVVQFTLVVSFKSGIFQGTLPVKIRINSPSEAVLGETSIDVFFEGGDKGINLISPMQLAVSEDGLYWIDVWCGEQLSTRIGLRVIYQRMVQGHLPLQGA